MDSSPKAIKEGKCPDDGDIMVYSEAKDGWVPASNDDILAAATKLGIYTLPAADGSAGDVLSTDGSGVLSWITP